jgi:CPA2 family monovalent cation:H+ antiporter-2
MHNFDLILAVAGGFVSALALGLLTQRLGLSPIVGYLCAGILVGPYTPGFVADPRMAEQLAEIGVILLMFGVGLQFHVEELLAVKRIAVPGAVAQSVVAAALGALIAYAVGWSAAAGIVFGIALSVASTVVLVRVLADNRDLHTQTGHIAVGWLVVEDLFTVLALVFLPTLLGGAVSATDLLVNVSITVVKVGALVAFAVLVGNRAIPWLLDRVSATRSRELFTLAVLSLALGIAVGASLVFNVSMALGAFLAGMVVGRSEYSLRAASEALPLRDAFAVLFFVSVGMLLNPRSLLDAPLVLLATLGVVMVGKPLVALVLVRLLRYPLRVALSVAVALAQIGEFSFMLSSLGRDLGVLSDLAANTLVAVSIVSIIGNPLLYRLVPAAEHWASRRPRLWRLLNPLPQGTGGGDGQAHASTQDSRHRAVVVGYGPTGRTVTRLLSENGIEPTVVELNIDSIRALREQGVRAVYGDARHAETLRRAGVDGASTLLLTSAGMERSEVVIRAARELNPVIHVLARTAYLRELPSLLRAGANGVFSDEGEVALAFTEAILRRLGATAEQVDRERSRVHADLVGRLSGGFVTAASP